MAEIVEFNGLTTLDIPIEKILDGAKSQDLEHAIVAGFTNDGELFLSSSTADIKYMIFLLEKIKQELLS